MTGETPAVMPAKAASLDLATPAFFRGGLIVAALKPAKARVETLEMVYVEPQRVPVRMPPAHHRQAVPPEDRLEEGAECGVVARVHTRQEVVQRLVVQACTGQEPTHIVGSQRHGTARGSGRMEQNSPPGMCKRQAQPAGAQQ